MIPPDLSIEYPFIKLPYNCAVKSFKNSKKNVEKEMSSVLNSIIILKNDEQINKEKASETINQLIGRLQNLKRKLKEEYQEQDQIYESCKKRILHLNAVSKIDINTQMCYHKTRLNRLIIDYLVREGHIKTAQKIMEEYQIQDLTELDMKVIMEANRITQDLKQKSCKEALLWCQQNRSKLTKINSKLEFDLIFQEFIELVRQNKILEAIAYMKKNSKQYTDKYFDEIKKAMGCLIVFNHKENSDLFKKYQNYFDESRWTNLIAQFKKENYNLFCLTSQSLFNITLQAGLSSLKTIYCFDENQQKKDKCPICNKLIGKLAEKVPSTLKNVSSLICRISGEIMDEHNYPVLLPNGHVYSYNAIHEMSQKNNGKIICPQTKQEFKISDIQKIYLT